MHERERCRRRSARAARHYPRGQDRSPAGGRDRRRLADSLRDVVLLLTSELVTNALRYSNGGICLTVRQTPDALRIEVQDANPAAPQLLANPGAARERGRGLHLVDRLATRWGHLPSADALGKTVWFELDRRPAATQPDSK